MKIRRAGIAQLVELHVANVVVAGSSPVSRSIITGQDFFPPAGRPMGRKWGLGFLLLTAYFLLIFGGIAKWLRQRSAKPLFTGSNPVAASIQESTSGASSLFIRFAW